MNIKSIIEQLNNVADPERREASKWYFPTSMNTLGVKSADLKNLLKTWWKELKAWPDEELTAFAKELVETRIFECNQAAFELLWKQKSALNKLSADDLETLGQNMDNWATTDSFAVILSGWAWRNGQISDDIIIEWANSDNLWWRRAALVSTVGMNLKSRGSPGDTAKTLMICEKVIDDRDDMIIKALSWALRELSKHDKPAVEEFMKKYHHGLAGKVRREVYTKLKTENKNNGYQ